MAAFFLLRRVAVAPTPIYTAALGRVDTVAVLALPLCIVATTRVVLPVPAPVPPAVLPFAAMELLVELGLLSEPKEGLLLTLFMM